MNPFLDTERRLRNGWWILLFFAFMASMLIPLLILRKGVVSFGAQLAIVAVASFICQLLRRRSIFVLIGRLDRKWPVQFLVGCAAGAALMLIPAGFLGAFGFVTWTSSGASLGALAVSLPAIVAIVATEELLFRGFLFQRLIDGLGATLAQILIAAYFLLTHFGALSSAGDVRPLASINIFVASLLFGLAYLRTRSLAMPLGLHFAANFTQGTILGFGVSGSAETSLLEPLRGSSPDWITGGSFGLEASLPGLIVILAATALYWWRSDQRA